MKKKKKKNVKTSTPSAPFIASLLQLLHLFIPSFLSPSLLNWTLSSSGRWVWFWKKTTMLLGPVWWCSFWHSQADACRLTQMPPAPSTPHHPVVSAAVVLPSSVQAESLQAA